MGGIISKKATPKIDPEVVKRNQERFQSVVNSYTTIKPDDEDFGYFYKGYYLPNDISWSEEEGKKYKSISKVQYMQGIEEYHNRAERVGIFNDVLREIKESKDSTEKYDTEVQKIVNEYDEKWSQFIMAWLTCEDLRINESQDEAQELHDLIFQMLEKADDLRKHPSLSDVDKLRKIATETRAKIVKNDQDRAIKEEADKKFNDAEKLRINAAYEKEYEKVKEQVIKRLKAAVTKLRPDYDIYIKEQKAAQLPNAKKAAGIQEGSPLKYKTMDLDQLGEINNSNPSSIRFLQISDDIGTWNCEWGDDLGKEWDGIYEKVNQVFEKLFEKYFPERFDSKVAPDGFLSYNFRVFPADIIGVFKGEQETSVPDYVRIPKTDVKRYNEYDIRWAKGVPYVIEKNEIAVPVIEVQAIFTEILLIFPGGSILNSIDFDDLA